MPSFEDLLNHCDEIIKALPPSIQGILDKAEQATKVPKNKMVAGGLVLCGLYMIFGYFAQFICNFVGFALPAYWSMVALETSSKEDDTRWLTYWVVFACFTCFDFFADGIFAYFPFYWLAKVIFLAWCFAPIQENGSQKIYKKLIRPYFLKKQNSIDSALKMGADAVSNLVSDNKKD